MGGGGNSGQNLGANTPLTGGGSKSCQ